MDRRKHTGLHRFWRETVRPILVVVVVCMSFRSAVADWNDVPTGSMKPTIVEGDRILVNKLAYDLKLPFTKWRLFAWADPARGDLVVCFSPKDGTRLVKRVIGVPGDRVEMRNNRLMINGQPLGYESLNEGSCGLTLIGDPSKYDLAVEDIVGVSHMIMLTPHARAPRSFLPITIPEGQYFVMGDNRDNSADSRFFGFVPRSEIVGRSSRVAFSLDYDRYYLPRLDRFLVPIK